MTQKEYHDRVMLLAGMVFLQYGYDDWADFKKNSKNAKGSLNILRYQIFEEINRVKFTIRNKIRKQRPDGEKVWKKLQEDMWDYCDSFEHELNVLHNNIKTELTTKIPYETIVPFTFATCSFVFLEMSNACISLVTGNNYTPIMNILKKIESTPSLICKEPFQDLNGALNGKLFNDLMDKVFAAIREDMDKIVQNEERPAIPTNIVDLSKKFRTRIISQ